MEDDMSHPAEPHVIPGHLADLAGVVVQDTPMPDPELLVARTYALLGSGIPLTLLLDLADPSGPHSAELWTDEIADLHWVPQLPA
jgi:hypothetical protein